MAWFPASGPDAQFLINCRPAFFRAAPVRRSCQQSNYCPDCWARAALATWRTVDALVFRRAAPAGPSPKGRLPRAKPRGLVTDDEPTLRVRDSRRPDLVLVRRLVEYPIPFAGMFVPDEDGPIRALACWYSARLLRRPAGKHRNGHLDRQRELRRLKALGVVGVLDVTGARLRLRPLPAGAPVAVADLPGPGGHLAHGWLAQVRQVLAILAEHVDRVIGNPRVSGPPPAIRGVAGTCRIVRREPATRRRLVAACGWAMAYPSFLLYGPAYLAHEAAEARRVFRATATAGIFRNRAGTGSGGEQAR
jgi:hypothetical protein